MDVSVREAQERWPEKALWTNFTRSMRIQSPEVIEAHTRQLLEEEWGRRGFAIGVTEDAPVKVLRGAWRSSPESLRSTDRGTDAIDMKPTPSPQTFPPQLVGLLITLTLGWGLNWPIMKAVLSEMEPMRFRTLCLLCGAAGLFTIARVSGLPVRVPRQEWPRLCAIALVNMTGWNIPAVYGIRLVASGRAAILGYTMPIWGVMLSTWLLRESFTRRRAVGTALGFSGLLLLLGEEVQAVGRSPLGAALMVTAAFFWALGTVLMKRWPVSLPTSAFTAWQMLIGVVPITIIALIIESGTFNPFALSVWPMLGTLYNMFVAFNFCYWAWMRIALLAPVGVSSLAIMMTPVVGVFSGMLLLRETPSWQDYAALALVVASLATVLLPPRAAKSPAEPPSPES